MLILSNIVLMLISSVNIVKSIMPSISIIMAHLINLAFSTGTLNFFLKVPTNHRKISILSGFSKVIEKCFTIECTSSWNRGNFSVSFSLVFGRNILPSMQFLPCCSIFMNV